MSKETTNHKTEIKPIIKKQTSKKNTNKFTLYLTIILLLIIILGAYYFFLVKKRSAQQLQVFRQQVVKNQQEISNLHAQLQNLESRQTQLLEQIQTYGFANTKWVLSSVVYLLQQAQLKLTVEHDINTAITLLNTAQQRVLSLHEQNLKPLSLAIKKDLSILTAINQPNFNQLINQFDLLDKRIAKLSIDITNNKPAISPTINHERGWRKVLANSWQTLRDVIVVQRTQHSFTPLLRQQQLVSFKQYLQSLAQQAFWGVLNDNAILYHQRLSAIKHALQRYLLPTNSDAKLIQRQIADLQKVKIVSRWPEQLLTLSLAKKLQVEKNSAVQGKH